MAKVVKGLSYLTFILPKPISRFVGQFAADFLLRLQFAQMRSRISSKDEYLSDWKQETQIFFMLGTGRSGTQFLSTLLDKIPETHVAHEPVLTDFAAYIRAFHSESEAYKYVADFRQKEIYSRVRNMRISSYGEVNGALRRHVEPLKEAFPHATLIHLVRDGRDVVRSVMSRSLFHQPHPMTRLLVPKKGDPWRKDWQRMDHFERVCWLWQIDNRFVRERTARTVQFEQLIADYGYFKERILEPLQLSLSEASWRQAVARPKNATKAYAMPHWSQWDASRREAFKRICGDEMKLCGYECEWESNSTSSILRQD